MQPDLWAGSRVLPTGRTTFFQPASLPSLLCKSVEALGAWDLCKVAHGLIADTIAWAVTLRSTLASILSIFHLSRGFRISKIVSDELLRVGRSQRRSIPRSKAFNSDINKSSLGFQRCNTRPALTHSRTARSFHPHRPARLSAASRTPLLHSNGSSQRKGARARARKEAALKQQPVRGQSSTWWVPRKTNQSSLAQKNLLARPVLQPRQPASNPQHSAAAPNWMQEGGLAQKHRFFFPILRRRSPTPPLAPLQLGHAAMQH